MESGGVEIEGVDNGEGVGRVYGEWECGKFEGWIVKWVCGVGVWRCGVWEVGKWRGGRQFRVWRGSSI